VVTQYAYDRAGNRIRVIDARGITTQQATYDAADRQISVTDGLGTTTSTSYDRLGRMTGTDDPRGPDNDLTYAYDGLDRPTGISATNLDAPIGMQYDALGQRTSMTDATGTTSVTHDALGRITGITAPDTGSIGYAYNARGQRTGLTYPDGTAIAYTYHADGQLHQVLQGGTPLATYAYDSAGRRDTLTRANGAVTRSTYDNADRLTDLQTTVGVTTTSRFQYSLDRMGQRTGITETLTTQTRTITSTYDGLQRLTGATETPGTTYAYSYDLAGNRTEVRENGALVANLSYNDANQVIGWSYDAAGNLLSDGTTTRSYNALNRLVAHDSTSYASNGDGVLVSDGTTTYAQDLAAPLSQVLSDGTDTYVYGHERLRTLGGPWYIGDALGSVRQTLDDAGAVRATTSYDPWGTPQDTLSAPFGFTGELHSAGQVYLRARWYAPGQGRFVSEDPFAGFPEMPYSLHAYQYGYSNPLRWTDPSGRCVGGQIGALDCTVIDFKQLSWSERKNWMRDFARKKNYGGWFRNIEDIIQFFSESTTLDTSLDGWASWSDAGVLEVIQDGWQRSRGLPEARAHDATAQAEALRSAAADAWARFFDTFPATPEQADPTILKPLWADAEQRGVNYGLQVAEDRLARQPTGEEQALITVFVIAGDTYRSIATVPEGGRQVGQAVGRTLGNQVNKIEDFPLLPPGTADDLGCWLGGEVGEWFTTPSSRIFPGMPGPTYYSARTIESLVEWIYPGP
jgi:RHS repeat-associated protein